MKKIIRLTESDLTLIVKRILKETAEVAQPQQQAQAQELYGKRKTRYGECLVGPTMPSMWSSGPREVSTGISKEEMKALNTNGSCKRCMKQEEPTQEDVRDCLGVLCELKTNGYNGKKESRHINMFNCFSGKYKGDFNVMSVMC
jgi:hypothetical protein